MTETVRVSAEGVNAPCEYFAALFVVRQTQDLTHVCEHTQRIPIQIPNTAIADKELRTGDTL